jgi:hypothetical protein
MIISLYMTTSWSPGLIRHLEPQPPPPPPSLVQRLKVVAPVVISFSLPAVGVGAAVGLLMHSWELAGGASAAILALLLVFPHMEPNGGGERGGRGDGDGGDGGDGGG